MKKKIFALVLTFMSLFSFSAYATDANYLKETKFTGWNYNKETQQQNYYINGEIVKNKWMDINNHRYYFKSNGEEAIGWLKLDNNWYYFDILGSMVKGWAREPNGKWYYLNNDGTMAHDTYIGNYYLGSDGSWIK